MELRLLPSSQSLDLTTFVQLRASFKLTLFLGFTSFLVFPSQRGDDYFQTWGNAWGLPASPLDPIIRVDFIILEVASLF